MSKAGWYPDPGGQPGMFRYWSGSTWAAAVTPNPPTAPGPEAHPQGSPLPAPKRNLWPWLLLAIGVIVVAVLATFVLRGIWTQISGGGTEPGGGNPPQNLCPKPKPSISPKPQGTDGLVRGGALSYPMLGSPWSPPSYDDRVPFGADVASQSVMIENNYDKRGHSWVASILVGELVAGDGFFSPKEGSEIVTRCIIGTFYGDAKVERKDLVNQATTVGGKEAWLVETHLTFNIPNLQTKGETAIILIVRTGEESSSLYYASIPDTSPQLLPVAKATMAKLKVG